MLPYLASIEWEQEIWLLGRCGDIYIFVVTVLISVINYQNSLIFVETHGLITLYEVEIDLVTQ